MQHVKIIRRESYMARIKPYIGKNLIKVLTGQRRVGKSYILMDVQDEIRRLDPDANIISINLEDFAFSHITDAASLNKEIEEKLLATKRNYIFIDEVQEVVGFEKVIRSLNLNSNNDIYVTGSNSAMLSSEIASRLAGRSVEIRVHPLSYQEFLQFHKFTDSDAAIDLFLRYGGMPYLINLNDTSSWNEYLDNLTDAMIFRDIISRNNIRNPDFLKRLLMFFADNIGQIFTAKKIADYLKSQRVSSSVASVQTYADHIASAYIVTGVKRWDIEGKRLFEIGEKYYFEDLGIRNSIIGYRPMDLGSLLENAVYNKLAADSYDIKVGVQQKGHEIDFVAKRDGEIKYIQVALAITEEATAAREFGNLEKISDNYDKIVVTLRDSAPNTRNGIRMLSLRQFLLSEIS